MAESKDQVARDQVFGMIRASGAQMIDVKFCGILGRWHHFTMPSDQFTERSFHEGIPFEAPQILGSNENLLLLPDPGTHFLDPFSQVPTLSIIADVCDARTKDSSPLDPRAVALRAQKHLEGTDLDGEARLSADLEFYIFDFVRYRNLPSACGYVVESAEGEWNTYRRPADGYQPANVNPRESGDHITPPRDTLHNVRNEISMRLKEAGLGVRYHHHDAGGPGQCEISLLPGSLVETADAILKAKYFIRMAALSQNRIATFMPKPIHNEAGSGLHVHQHIAKGGASLFFAEDDPGQLSPTARYYVGGLLAHAPALMALTNPSTNSYKRLATIPTASDQPLPSGILGIPKTVHPQEDMRVEFLAPDATSNSYLALAALLMAGLDGLRRELDPVVTGGRPLPASLEGALAALEGDHAFLLAGDVFTEHILGNWIRMKHDLEVREIGLRPHPYEYQLYLDL
jgi:glutamine synthetase